MRTAFANWFTKESLINPSMMLLTGDLGYNCFEELSATIGNKFINCGVAEQNMVGVAAGLAQQGLVPFCYSIAPFLIYRPYEQIRVDVGLHKLNVKLVGNGGGYGYGIMGATHHAIEDFAVMSAIPNLKCFIPYCVEDVEISCHEMSNFYGPSYLRLGISKYESFQPESGSIIQIHQGNEVTIVGVGALVPMLKFAQAISKVSCDIFAVRQIPFDDSIEKIKSSLRRTQKLLIVEEHIRRGGVGELLVTSLATERINYSLKHIFAVGYPGGLYGSQNYHQVSSGLNQAAVIEKLKEFCRE